ncbi:MAG: hypothetical protein AB8I08_13045 [Sandaracinaceae bacterium]
MLGPRKLAVLRIVAAVWVSGCGARGGLSVPTGEDASIDSGAARIEDAARPMDSGMDAGVVLPVDAGPVGAPLNDASTDATGSGGADGGDDASTDGDAARCDVRQSSCGGRCVNTDGSVEHCGGCGRRCGSDQRCVAGTCECSAGETFCESACVDTSRSDRHCGGCDSLCLAPATCDDGACRCPPGFLLCAGRCVDPETDRLHCGGCGVVCDVRCDAGVCLDVVSHDVSRTFSSAALSDGSVWSWGSCRENQCGALGVATHSRPQRVEGVDEVVSVATGSAAVCALRRDGTVWCWGEGQAAGLLGDADPNPNPLAGLDSVTQLEAGGAVMCAIRSEGDVWCWGVSVSGMFGSGSGALRQAPRPIRIEGIPPASAISIGQHHICTVSVDTSLYCWGENVRGQLGRGYVSQPETPAPVAEIASARAVSALEWGTCALDAEGRAYCWGGDAFGSRGDGAGADLFDDPTPRPVDSGVTGFVSLQAAAVTTCALTPDGEAWCWGNGQYGAMAHGSREHASSPIRPSDLGTIEAVRLAKTSICIQSAEHGLRCAGWNYNSTVGDGTTDVRLRPSAVEW